MKGTSPTGNADADRVLGNILGNVLATGAGAFVGGSSGAATSSAANLYNDQLHCTNESCKGGTRQLLRDTIANVASLPGKWNALVDNGISQFNGLMNSDAAAKAGESPAALIAQGTANGISAIIGSKGGEPPMANPGAVLADSTASITAGSAGYVPSNATLNSGNNDGSSANSGSTGSSTNNSGPIQNAENAQIDPRKITGYVLDPEHPVGGNKARVFESALGFNQSNADGLISQIQDGVTKYPATPGKADQFGQRFTVDIPVTGPNGNTVQVRTGWIYDPGSSTPRLTTMFVK